MRVLTRVTMREEAQGGAGVVKDRSRLAPLIPCFNSEKLKQRVNAQGAWP